MVGALDTESERWDGARQAGAAQPLPCARNALDTGGHSHSGIVYGQQTVNVAGTLPPGLPLAPPSAIGGMIADVGEGLGFFTNQMVASLSMHPNGPGPSGNWNNGNGVAAAAMAVPQSPKCASHGLGLGVIGAGTAEAGAGAAGAGATGSAGAGLFYSGPNGLSGGGFTEGGTFANAGSRSVGAPAQNDGSLALGAFTGAGGGVFVTNAGSPQELSGPFLTFSGDIGMPFTGAISIQISISSNNTFLFSATYGPGAGIAGSAMTTITETTGGSCP